MQSATLILILLWSGFAWGTFKTPLKIIPVNEKVLQDDLERIESKANLPKGTLSFKLANNARINCRGNQIELSIHAAEEEKTSALYKGLRQLGFLFPHPLTQISPTLSQMKKHCGEKISWKPTLKYRGLHLHTLHPSEWVAAFYQDRPEVADATVRWLARNQQNLMDLSLLRVPLSEIKRQMRPHFELARGLQIHTGVSLGIALQQQNSYKLLSLFESYLGSEEVAYKKIKRGLTNLNEALPLSFVVLEAGTSEFTPTDFEKTLKWLNYSGKTLQDMGLVHLTKIHVSSNQYSSKWGNYNFLPQYADASVGVLPHTVMFYGPLDEKAPMYGNENFHGIRDFTLKEKDKRPTWYYPETSYWVAMDVDIPLMLTDYLVTRAQDMQWLNKNQIEGQLNFTTGHALGYWLYDWSIALLTDSEFNFDPMTALKLLGENEKVWKEIIDYQSHWYKKKGLIAYLSSANLQDELSKTHRIHDRFTMKQLVDNQEETRKEVELLKASLKAFPDFTHVKDDSLRDLLTVTKLRQEHALHLRHAIIEPMNRDNILALAKETRLKAKEIIQKLSIQTENYPELPMFKKWKNPTSYQFGYVYPAQRLYFWEREERQVRTHKFFPFSHNIYDIWNILF